MSSQPSSARHPSRRPVARSTASASSHPAGSGPPSMPSRTRRVQASAAGGTAGGGGAPPGAGGGAPGPAPPAGGGGGRGRGRRGGGWGGGGAPRLEVERVPGGLDQQRGGEVGGCQPLALGRHVALGAPQGTHRGVCGEPPERGEPAVLVVGRSGPL